MLVENSVFRIYLSNVFCVLGFVEDRGEERNFGYGF